jgi:hypothetical protein
MLADQVQVGMMVVGGRQLGMFVGLQGRVFEGSSETQTVNGVGLGMRLVCELRYVGLLELGLQMVVGYVAHGLLEVGQQKSGSQKPRSDL